MSVTDVDDRRVIRELIENWAVWRDALMWDRFRTVWHDDGRMMATWFQGTAEEFIKVSQDGYARGVRILHFLGGSSIDIAGPRAIAQTKMTISQRARAAVGCSVVGVMLGPLLRLPGETPAGQTQGRRGLGAAPADL